jgi:hypothetical protein
MLLAYLDESYDKAEYWLTALVVPSDSALQLQNDLDGVVNDATMSGYNLPPDAELHGHQLVHGKGDWESMAAMVRARIQIYAKALRAIAACDGAEIAMRGIDIKRLNDRYTDPWHPHRVAIDFMAQSLNALSKRRDTHFLAIADEIEQADTLRASYWAFQRYGTLSYWSGAIDRAVDALHFAPSKHSRLLQAADLVSYLHFRMRRSGVTDPRAIKANRDLWDIIAAKRKVWQIWP